jgi:Phytanoyl-CoA dioxygenase (PhyH)
MSYVMQLGPDGAQLFRAAFAPDQTTALELLLPDLADERPGARLNPIADLVDTISPATNIAAKILGPGTRPVRAMLFDKSPARNWALGWHQDRTIAVRERIDAPGFADWTVKHGILHVIPPFDLLKRMLTARIHLDPVTAENAPLLVARGSHRFGAMADDRITRIRPRLDQAACLAERGDLWLYATPILHASTRAACPSRRRVLQVLYSADDLPSGLAWLGV